MQPEHRLELYEHLLKEPELEGVLGRFRYAEPDAEEDQPHLRQTPLQPDAEVDQHHFRPCPKERQGQLKHAENWP